MEEARRSVVGPASEVRDYGPVLRWLLVTCLVVIGFGALWYLGLIQTMFATDRTHISTLILILFVITSLHCLLQALQVSRELVVARRTRAVLAAESTNPTFTRAGGNVVTGTGVALERSALATHIANLIDKAARQKSARLDQTLLLKTVASQLRSREKIGVFVSEALLRLALLGTAIGFILMLVPIAALSSFDADTLRTALAGMTSGMAVALNVTVSGIACALILKFEYYQLDGALTELFDSISDTSEIYVVPALERGADARS